MSVTISHPKTQENTQEHEKETRTMEGGNDQRINHYKRMALECQRQLKAIEDLEAARKNGEKGGSVRPALGLDIDLDSRCHMDFSSMTVFDLPFVQEMLKTDHWAKICEEEMLKPHEKRDCSNRKGRRNNKSHRGK